jgi:hypothetical protein
VNVATLGVNGLACLREAEPEPGPIVATPLARRLGGIDDGLGQPAAFIFHLDAQMF